MNTIIDEDIQIITDGIVLEITRYSLAKSKYFLGFIATAELKDTSIDPLEDVWDKVH